MLVGLLLLLLRHADGSLLNLLCRHGLGLEGDLVSLLHLLLRRGLGVLDDLSRSLRGLDFGTVHVVDGLEFDLLSVNLGLRTDLIRVSYGFNADLLGLSLVVRDCGHRLLYQGRV